MPRTAFATIRDWVFDLDNTLYPATSCLFDQIEVLMTNYMTSTIGIDPAEATALRAQYWRDYGTTLAGLMRHHGTDPDDFLDKVHDIDLTGLTPDPDLRARIAALPGRRIVHTNGSRAHGEQVVRALGLDGVFEAIYGVEDADYVPKPHAVAFSKIAQLSGIEPARGAMFEDDARNLAVPHKLGMRTVLVGPPEPAGPHVHHITDDLSNFLGRLR